MGNSTIANNRAGGDGGGIGASGGSSTTELSAVTVARNLADADSVGGGLGGGLYQGAGDVISVANTIVALNALGAGATGPDCFNASTGFDSLGHNLIGDVDGCTGFDAPGDLIGGPLRLGKLADNGGADHCRRPPLADDRTQAWLEGDQRRGPRARRTTGPARRQARQEARHRRLRAEVGRGRLDQPRRAPSAAVGSASR